MTKTRFPRKKKKQIKNKFFKLYLNDGLNNRSIRPLWLEAYNYLIEQVALNRYLKTFDDQRGKDQFMKKYTDHHIQRTLSKQNYKILK